MLEAKNKIVDVSEKDKVNVLAMFKKNGITPADTLVFYEELLIEMIEFNNLITFKWNLSLAGVKRRLINKYFHKLGILMPITEETQKLDILDAETCVKNHKLTKADVLNKGENAKIIYCAECGEKPRFVNQRYYQQTFEITQRFKNRNVKK